MHGPATLSASGAFPGLLGRGLIEARSSPRGWSGTLVATFPGLLGRGLIEASSAAAAMADPLDGPFPGLLGRGLIEVEWTR